MKKYTAAEAIELAKSKDCKSVVFVDQDELVWDTSELWKASILSDRSFTAYRLVPLDDDKISKAAAEGLKKSLSELPFWTLGDVGKSVIGTIEGVVDLLTRSEE